MAKNVKKATTTALANWDEDLAKYAKEASDKEQTPAGSFISVKSGVLTVAGQPVKDNKAVVVVLHSIYENAMYDGKFDPDNPRPPCCYAFSEDEEGLKPHEKSSEPQHEQCRGCPKNEFGTADTGKGKACKNIRRLALISSNGLTADNIKDVEAFFFKLPVTSVKAWSLYVKNIANVLKRPPFGVLTEIAVVPDAKTQFKVTFNEVGTVESELMAGIMAKRAEVAESIAFPYPEARAEEEPAKPAKGKGRKF